MEHKLEDYILKKVKYMNDWDALTYIERYLMLNPVFEAYKKAEKNVAHQMKSSAESEEYNYPLLAKVKRYPKAYNNYALLVEFVSTCKNYRKKIEAYRLLLKYATNKEERLSYAKEIMEYSKKSKDIYQYGLELFNCEYYEEAVKVFYEAMPHSILALARCYEEGIGVEKNTDKALELLVEGCKNRNTKALLAARKLIYRLMIKDTLIDEWRNVKSFEVPIEDQDVVLRKYIEQGHLTENDIELFTGILYGDIDDSFKNLLSSYGIQVIHSDEVDTLAVICRLDSLFKKLDDAIHMAKWSIYLDDYSYFKQLVLFYVDGYEDINVKYGEFSHTPSEAAIFLDVPLYQAQADYRLLRMYLKNEVFLKDVMDALCALEEYLEYKNNEDATFKVCGRFLKNWNIMKEVE